MASPRSTAAPTAGPRRSDARRNIERIIAVARAAYAESGHQIGIEEIARRAGVGVGTIYRSFGSRRGLLEAVYIDEIEQVCRDAATRESPDERQALRAFLKAFVRCLSTKKALIDELSDDHEAPVFQRSRACLYGTGEPLLAQAQAAGLMRGDITLDDVLRIVMGVARMLVSVPPVEAEHVLEVALDGLNAQPAGPSTG